MSDNAVVDFETEAIESRPKYPPRPVGVAVKLPGERKGKYYAFGHPTDNNSTIAEARDKVRRAYSVSRVLFHNGNFDMDVGETHFGLHRPNRYEDTTFLAFLNDPYERELKLKKLAAKHLNMPPDEQELLRDWIIENIKLPGRKKITTKNWGEHICRAPGGLAGVYAVGDLDRTEGLYEHYLPIIERRGMREAYERELKVLPISLEMERSGIRVDRKRLKELQAVLESLNYNLITRIQRSLGVIGRGQKPVDKEKFNVESGPQLAKALVAARKLDAQIKTPTGRISTKVSNLRATCNDKALLDNLAVQSVVSTYLGTFVGPWLLQSAITGGRILPRFNQTRNDGGGGARSGRFSSSNPNLQNIPSNPEDSQNKDTLLLLQKLLKEEENYDFQGLRDYILPDEGCIMIPVDYNQQELRILAHFEEGELMDAYLANPRLDVHDFFRLQILNAIGVEFPRKHVKVTVFGIIYGMGLEKLAARLGITKDTAKTLRDALFKVCPGIPRIMKELKRLADKDKPLVTWGGREYFCEEPRWMKNKHNDDPNDGDWVSFEYKMFNYKIQPSAADITKQGMINVAERVPQVRIAIQVHDELVSMARHRKYGPRIAEAMCDIKPFNIQMLADPKYSETTWARAK